MLGDMWRGAAIELLQVTVLALVQGLTEFLPVSSSGHLLLPSVVFGWPDQGLAFDIAVHVGTLIAVITYLRADVLALCVALFRRLTGGSETTQSRLALQLILATLPAGLMGILLKDLIQGDVRALGIVAVTSIVFALLLWAADARAQRRGDAQGLETLGFAGALFIGCAQALALIPGTSRSGVTLTAARILGLRRESAAKFSFLLSIPIILASGLLLTVDAAVDEPSFDWGLLAYAAFASALVAFASIHFFMRLLPRVGVLPFVIYRLLFGAALLLWLS